MHICSCDGARVTGRLEISVLIIYSENVLAHGISGEVL